MSAQAPEMSASDFAAAMKGTVPYDAEKIRMRFRRALSNNHGDIHSAMAAVNEIASPKLSYDAMLDLFR
jgi:hypothetical protein